MISVTVSSRYPNLFFLSFSSLFETEEAAQLE